MSKSIKKSIKGTRKNFDSSIEGISRTGKRCKKGYNFDKKTQLCRGKLKISIFNNLGDLHISKNENSISFEPANDKQTIMKLYKEGSLVQQIVMSEKEIRQCTKRGNKKISKLIKGIERVKNNPKILKDPKIVKRIKHHKYNGGGEPSPAKNSEIYIPENLLPVINSSTSKIDKLKNKIIELQTELDKISKFQNSDVGIDYFNTFIENYSWLSAGVFGLVVGGLAGAATTGVAGAISLGVLSMIFVPIFMYIVMFATYGFNILGLWIQNGILDMTGLGFIEYYINYIEVQIQSLGAFLSAQFVMSREMINTFHEDFDLLRKYNYNKADITAAGEQIQKELEEAKIDLMQEMSKME